MNRIFVCVLLFWTLLVASVDAGVASKAVTETVEFVMKTLGKEVAQEGAESLTKKATTLATKYGDDGLEAFRKCGPAAFRCVEEAGEQAAPDVVRLMAKRGDEAIWVVSKPNRTAIFLKHGDDAAEAMIKHKEIVEPLLGQFGKPAATALSNVSSQNARRLAMMSADGELAKIGRSDELLGVIGKYGDSAMEFVWKNKGALAVTATLAAFLLNPEPFINGGKELVSMVGEPIARSTNWTLVIIIFGGIAVLYFFGLPRLWKNRKVGK